MKFLLRLTLASVVYTCFVHVLESTCVIITRQDRKS